MLRCDVFRRRRHADIKQPLALRSAPIDWVDPKNKYGVLPSRLKEIWLVRLVTSTSMLFCSTGEQLDPLQLSRKILAVLSSVAPT